MLGAAIGIACGSAGFFLLRFFCRKVTQDARAPIWLALANPAVLLLGMALCAWLCPMQLIWAGTGMAAMLVVGAMAEMIRALRQARRQNAERECLEPGSREAGRER